MTKIMKGGIAYNSTANMVALTQAEYDALTTAQKNNGNFYFITDADPSYFSAENIDYDNTSSGLSATDIQSAVDEVYGDIPSNATELPISANDTTDTKAYIDNAIATSEVFTPTLSHVSTSTGASEKIWYWKSGKVVTMAVDIILDTTGSSVVMQLPSGFRPPVNITSAAQAFSSTATSVLRYVQIYANGNVSFYSQDQSRLLFTITFGV